MEDRKELRVPVRRQLETDLATGIFRPKFSETINSKYELSVEASNYTEDRMSFSFQAVGSQLILSPLAFVDIDLTVQGSGHLPESQADLAVTRSMRNVVVNSSNNGAIADINYGNLIGFGPGDALSEAISSIQVTVNSCSITSTERDRFWRSLMRCWIKDSTMERIYDCLLYTSDAADE